MSLQIEITTDQEVDVIEVAGAGPQGPQGIQGEKGDTGAGIPAGGVEFDLIEKASGDDFDTRFTNTPTVRGLQLDTANAADPETGRIIWNDGDEVPQFVSNGITTDISLEMLARCRNVTGQTIPKGTAVCIVGASATRISIAPSDRTQPGSACRTLGLTLEDIANNNFGKVSTFGLVRGLDTAAIDGDEGDELFVGATPGSLTTTPPDAPARRLTVGYLVTKNPNTGRVFVSIRRGVRVDEIDDVQQVGAYVDGDVLRFQSASGRWENVQLGSAADSDAGDFDPAGSAAGVQSNLETHIDDSTNPHNVTKAQVGLSNVDNVSAANLRDRATHTGEQAIGTVTGLQAELDDKATNASLSAHIADDTNPHQVTATQVGLGNVDNTADLDKPISTATQAALDDKADKTTQVIAGTGLDGGGDLSGDRTLNLDSATVASLGKADTALQPSDNVSALTNDAQYIDAAGAPVQSVNGETGAVSLDKGDVGLGNVPNLDTTDAVNKAHDQNTDTALASGTADEVTAADARAHIDATDNPHSVTAAQVGLGNVDNTSDADKPISTATQAEIDAQVDSLLGRKEQIAQGFVQRERARGDLDVDLAVAIELNLIGAPVVGGFYAGIIDTIKGDIIAADAYQTGERYALIVGPKALEAGPGKRWYVTNTGDPEGADTRWDGLSATNSILSLGDPDFEAHEHIADVRTSNPPPATPGGSDWYMPAMDELELLYRNFKPNDEDNRTDAQPGRDFPGVGQAAGVNPSSDPVGLNYENDPRIPDETFLELFKENGDEALDQLSYWSTTWAATDRAWSQTFTISGNEGFQAAFAKGTTSFSVRPVRRVAL